MKIEVQGSPSEDEVAAIVAAIEMVWPKPVSGIAAREPQSTTWRYAALTLASKVCAIP